MNLNKMFLKRAASSAVVIFATGILLGSLDMSKTKSIRSHKTTAGVTAEIAKTIEVKEDTEKSSSALTASSNDSSQAEITADSVVQEVDPWANKLMTNELALNVRSTASEEGEIVGRLHKGDLADIISSQDGWYQISSGTVSGFVKAEYAVTGQGAEELADSIGSENLGTAETAEEIAANEKAWEEAKAKKEAEAKAAYEKAAAAKASSQAAVSLSQEKTSSAYQTNTSADDVTLMAAIIQLEAGNEPYEGQVAVGSVIMNRLRRGYASTIQGVIFQKGQFYSSSSTRLSNVLSKGVKSSCISAAQEALAGRDEVGGRTQFRPVSSGKSGLVIGHHVFF